MSVYQTSSVVAVVLAVASIILVGFVQGMWAVAAAGAIGLVAAAVAFTALDEIIAELQKMNQFLWDTEFDRKKGQK